MIHARPTGRQRMSSEPITPPARGRVWKFLRRTAAGGILLEG